ncbi:MAG TPA: Holliday junction branch migration protein RuvA, partial [Candidatus Barnesiella excrementipullorum]|nr:Holliday junction branch migration protein RuvA [Candidatus Barnesiella excrementipullorum]
MIEYINGTVAELTPASAVIETAAGVGYFLNISLGTYSALKQGEHAKLYVYEAIREDAYVLYGFKGRREREIFQLLISVSGVGPNTARMILSSLSPDEIEQIVATENIGV